MESHKLKRFVPWLLAALLLIISDQISKTIIQRNFFPNESISVINDFFRISFVKNRGIAFGMFNKEHTPEVDLFLYITPVAIIILSYLFASSIKHILQKISFLFILSGALGNYIDRLKYGYVVDFFDFEFFDILIPKFNIAGVNFSGYELTLFIHTIFFEISNEKSKDKSTNVI